MAASGDDGVGIFTLDTGVKANAKGLNFHRKSTQRYKQQQILKEQMQLISGMCVCVGGGGWWTKSQSWRRNGAKKLIMIFNLKRALRVPCTPKTKQVTPEVVREFASAFMQSRREWCWNRVTRFTRTILTISRFFCIKSAVLCLGNLCSLTKTTCWPACGVFGSLSFCWCQREMYAKISISPVSPSIFHFIVVAVDCVCELWASVWSLSPTK